MYQEFSIGNYELSVEGKVLKPVTGKDNAEIQK
jgi:hypothetical protein